uniref:Uncharacterized protein n=1 Tax=Klebsiella pneumoniae TaxID=573 RepID=A0A8B0SS14_KLEPN|nr:hypothetical protein [Klebsiella pneumoniae]
MDSTSTDGVTPTLPGEWMMIVTSGSRRWLIFVCPYGSYQLKRIWKISYNASSKELHTRFAEICRLCPARSGCSFYDRQINLPAGLFLSAFIFVIYSPAQSIQFFSTQPCHKGRSHYYRRVLLQLSFFSCSNWSYVSVESFTRFQPKLRM